jgi:thiamine-phosphate pyrophosphorylase
MGILRCHITDRKLAGGIPSLLEAIARNLQAGIEYVQIREKDLPPRELYELAKAAMALPNPHGTRFLINGRVDVALAVGAQGVQLPTGSLAPFLYRSYVPERFVIGVSCHSLDDVQRAAEEDADLALFGPVFDPLSKAAYGPAAGLDRLREVTQVRLPVFALGGITAERIPLCEAAGVAGVAGITLFQGK